MKRLIVTGLDGFVGQHVRRALETGHYGHFRLVVPRTTIELTEPATLTLALEETQPDCVLHLAAQSFIPESIRDPRATYEVNFFGTLNLLEALKSHGFGGRILYIGSADVYGAVSDKDLPVVETHPLRPRTPYGVSKAAAELLCYQWTQDQGLDIVMTRPFNHIGPGQAEHFVVPDFAKQIAEIKLGRREPVIKVGAIDVTRDFTDVRDVVAAYLSLIDRGVTGEVYNVCSGREYSIRDVLNELIRLADVQCGVVSDDSRLRAAERRRNRGSFDKLRNCTGWEPRIPLTDSLRDVLAYWDKKLVNNQQ
jgi:GDP-4-dehydro-6-deoxy-D-mannose reductase